MSTVSYDSLQQGFEQRAPPLRYSANNRATNATYGIRETRLVIGVDFGTTYTGIAYAVASGTRCTLNDIDPITNWGEQMNNHDKVPSVYSYTPPKNREQQWGSSLSPDAVTMIHTKLMLGLQSIEDELNLTLQVLDGMKDLHFEDILRSGSGDRVPVYSAKNPETIVKDYLTKVFKYCSQEVQGFSEAFNKHTPTDVVVTIPTDWDYMAMNSTYQAVVQAGFNHRNFPRLNPIKFISESEAAARYTARYYREVKGLDFLQDNEYFVLCDAGGGTVDVVSYKVTQVHPVMQLKQVGKPSGEKCGSIFINRAFKRWLRAQIGDKHYLRLDRNLDIEKPASNSTESAEMRELMKVFDERKESFAYPPRDVVFDLTPPLHNITVPGVVNSGELTIPSAVMEEFFDRCIRHIVAMVKFHMRQIEMLAQGRPQNLFLVGGFGASKYLEHHIAETLKQWDINFKTPETSWTAIVQGAVVCGIEHDQVTSLRVAGQCRYSYAICLDEVFRDGLHTSGAQRAEINGVLFAQGQLIWLMNEGDLIIQNESRTVERDFDIEFSRSQNFIFFPVYSHSGSHLNDRVRPSRIGNAANELTEACSLRLDLAKLRSMVDQERGSVRGFTESMYQDKSTASGAGVETRFSKIVKKGYEATLRSTYTASLKLQLVLQGESLQASILWKGKVLVSGPVAY